MEKTQKISLFPWIGGVNSSLDPSTIPPNQLTKAYNLIFGVRGSRKKREGINFDWDDASNGSESIIGLHDFWYGASSRTQRIVAVTSGKKVYSYNGGTRSADLFSGTAWSSAITTASMVTLNNLLHIAVDGSGNVMKKWDGTTFANLGGTPPEASICREHLGRLWTNDKTNLDRLHYSTTANTEEWNGAGDSGAIDIGVGDGDAGGIQAIFPTYQGVLFVAKKTKLYKIVGDAPENFQVIKVSDSLGCVSHNSIATIDQSDVFFMSEKGIHSLATTDQFGDFAEKYVSYDIQGTFNDEWTKSRLRYAWGAYLPHINSYAIAVTDEQFGADSNNAIWLYNIPLKSWSTWPNLSCQSLITATDSDKKRFYFGTSTTRVAKTFNGTNYDVSTSGSNTAIPLTIETGYIYPQTDPEAVSAFRYFSLLYKPVGTHQITVTLKIDNKPVQGLSFSETSSSALLGSTFVLGSSSLGYDVVLAPYRYSIDGYGHGIKVKIEQTGNDQEVEIQGLAIGFLPAGGQQEVQLTA